MKRFSGTGIALAIFLGAVFLFHGSDLRSFFRPSESAELSEIRGALDAGVSSDGLVALHAVTYAPRIMSEKVPDHRRRLRAFLGRAEGDWDLHVFIEQSYPAALFRVDTPYRVLLMPEGIRWEGEHRLAIWAENADRVPQMLILDLDQRTLEVGAQGTHRDARSAP